MYRIEGRIVKIPTTGRIKIRGDMYGPLNTPHFETLDDIKLMLTYNVEVIGFKEVGGDEEKLTLENYANENIVVLGHDCKHDATSEKLKAVTLPMLGQTEVDAGILEPELLSLNVDEAVNGEKEAVQEEQPNVAQEAQARMAAQVPAQKNKNKK